MKLLAVSHDYDWSGAPLALYRVLAGLVARGHEVHLLVDGGETHTGSLIKPALAAGIAVVDGVAVGDYDLVLCNTLVMGKAVVAVDQRAPVVWWVLEPVFGLDLIDQGKVDFRAFELATRIVFPTRWQASTLYSGFLKHDRISVIPLGAPAPELAPAPPSPEGDGPLRLVHIGRVEHRKGQDVTLEAISKLAPGQVELDLLGAAKPTPYTHEIKAKIDELCARGHVIRPHGVVSNDAALAVLSRSDVLVAPTRDDLLNLTVVEAMGLARCAITTSLPPMVEGLRDGQDAILIPSGDAEALSGHLDKLSRDRPRLSTIGAEARRSYEAHFTLRAHIDAMERVLHEVAQGSS
ncbi:MAG: glycosyltransferase family 4 protein [Rhodospirillaceae bacterium]|nr:glycosyltransferase family 4 protein [Rhodospirillaceae bacterium]